MELILIRHGQTIWNQEGRWQGWQDIPLNERGRSEAWAVAEALAKEDFSAIYSSDLSRAVNTARPLAELSGRPLNQRSELREMGFGLMEGLSRGEGQATYPEFWQAYLADSLNTVFPNGESFAEVLKRTNHLIQEFLTSHGNDRVVLVSHGGPLRAILCSALELDPRRRGRIRLDNTGVCRVSWTKERIEILSLNDLAHLATLKG